MTTNPYETAPAYLVDDDGRLHLNEAAKALMAALDRSSGIAHVAGLFVRHASLTSITIRLSTRWWECYDSRARHLTGKCLVENATLTPSCAQAEGLFARSDASADMLADLTEELDDAMLDQLAIVLISEKTPRERIMVFHRAEILAQVERLPRNAALGHTALPGPGSSS